MANLSMRAMGLGSLGAVIGVVVLTIVAELAAPVKTVLTQLMGHHWVTKGVAGLAVFVLLGGLVALAQRAEETEEEGTLWAWIVSGVALLGLVVLFLFFIGYFVAAG